MIAPIKVIKKLRFKLIPIIKNKIATKEDLEKINKQTIEKIKSAADFALKSPYPIDSDLYTDVFI